ncbi:MAG: DUF362 domain-containing protein [Endomicrobiales bacterium]|nr:DUF362 domain-containing protein [Endomicrobiales bacterium]
MKSEVFYLPWEKISQYDEWLDGVGIEKIVSKKELVALKIHFGEKGNKGFIKPSFVAPLAKRIKEQGAFPFLTDANTIYVGDRADAYHHALVAEEHGFNIRACGCPVIIADGLRGNAGHDVQIGLKHFKKVSIANSVHYSDSILLMSHFKGHEITGFGGLIKNAGMGCGTRAGKYAMHHSVLPKVSPEKCTGCGVCVKWCPAGALELSGRRIKMDKSKCVGCGECTLSCKFGVFDILWDEAVSSVQEKIVEYAYGVLKGKKHFGINFLNHITQYCDCYPTKGAPLVRDIGVMAASDPVALDQAGADKVNEVYGSDFWKKIFPHIDWNVQLEYAQKLGLGTRQYRITEF